MRHFKFMLIVIMFISLSQGTLSAQKLNSDLIKAAKKGQIEKVQSVLEQGADINTSDKKGRTALMFAAEKGHIDVVRLLLESGADILKTDNKGESALSKATKKEKKEVILLFEFASIKRDWEKAQRLNTTDAYQKYLRKHPESGFTVEAKSRIQDLDWLETQSENSIGAYQKFLRDYPKSVHESQAREWIDALLAAAFPISDDDLNMIKKEIVDRIAPFELSDLCDFPRSKPGYQTSIEKTNYKRDVAPDEYGGEKRLSVVNVEINILPHIGKVDVVFGWMEKVNDVNTYQEKHQLTIVNPMYCDTSDFTFSEINIYDYKSLGKVSQYICVKEKCYDYDSLDPEKE